MSNLLDAANASTDKFIIGKLPTNQGEVSIMTLAEIYTALGGSFKAVYDPSRGYDTSTYYVYAINDGQDLNHSTLIDLQDIDINWYRQLNKPTNHDDCWTLGKHTLMGGPLDGIYCYGYYYDFSWYYISDCNDSLFGSSCSESSVPGSTCVVVVHS